MPSALSYPGVYIEEVPSGVRTITGVATSIAAFVGRTSRGPVDSALTVNSYGEFERLYGGIWPGSVLPFAVRDFFLNGGAQAVIVRLYHVDETAGAANAAARISISTGAAASDKLTLEAASPGKWGESLRASIDVDVAEAVAASFGLVKTDLFNLTIRDSAPGGASEVFRNLTLKDSPRRIDQVLKVQSALLRWQGVFPPGTLPSIASADDDISSAEKRLKTAQAAQPPVPADIAAANTALAAARAAVLANDGLALALGDFSPSNGENNKKGLYALEQVDLFNLLCLPPYLSSGDVDTGLVSLAAAYCEKRRALLLVDPPSGWANKQAAKAGIAAGIGTNSKNAALYFPRLRQPNPLRDNQSDDFVPCGSVAGVMARTDVMRGVWKAPAGLDATLNNVPALSVNLTDPEIGELNPLAVNCLRPAPAAGRVVWGARTLQGDDRLASEWKYVPVRRLALFLEESLYRGTQWVVFEPNDEPLWAQIRLNLGAFMHGLFRQGAFQGMSPKEAYFVKCDKETTTQADINLGVVNIVVGFAPLKPAEFVVIKLQQIAGQLAA